MDIALQNRCDLPTALFCIWCRAFRGFVGTKHLPRAFTYYRLLHVGN